MSETLARAFTADLEIRASGDGRTIAGIVVPFDRTARVSDGGPSYDECFRMGAFTRTIQHRGDRVKLLSQHDSRTNPLGRATLLREDSAGLYGEFKVSETQAGSEALALVRDGALDSFSVGFTPIKHEKQGQTVIRTEVALREASLVTFPAYDDARISAVRQATACDLISRGYTPESVERALIEGDLTRLVFSGDAPVNVVPETTPDGDSDPAARTVSDPASATRDALTHFRSLRLLAREKGIL